MTNTKSQMQLGVLLVVLVILLVLVAVWVVSNRNDHAVRDAAIAKAKAQVQRLAEDLDRRTTETGVYVRVKEDDIKEVDPWGVGLNVTYSQGGFAEVVSVRSAGPDCKFHTGDDIVSEGMVGNLKGIGAGIKKNAEETASNTAAGVVKGTVRGLKESIKESLPLKKRNKKDGDPKPKSVMDGKDAPPEQKPAGE